MNDYNRSGVPNICGDPFTRVPTLGPVSDDAVRSLRLLERGDITHRLIM